MAKRSPKAAAPAPAAQPAATRPTARHGYGTIKVRAIADGYYGDKLRRVGDVFEIDATPLRVRLEEQIAAGEIGSSTLRGLVGKVAAAKVDAGGPLQPTPQQNARLDAPAAFSSRWMERVDARTPDSITSHNAVLRRQHDETLAARAEGRPTGDAPVLGDD